MVKYRLNAPLLDKLGAQNCYRGDQFDKHVIIVQYLFCIPNLLHSCNVAKKKNNNALRFVLRILIGNVRYFFSSLFKNIFIHTLTRMRYKTSMSGAKLRVCDRRQPPFRVLGNWTALSKKIVMFNMLFCQQYNISQ